LGNILHKYWGIFYTNIQISTVASTKDYFEKLRESNIFSCFINNQSSLSLSPQLVSFIVIFTSVKKKHNSSLFLISERKSVGLLLPLNQLDIIPNPENLSSCFAIFWKATQQSKDCSFNQKNGFHNILNFCILLNKSIQL